MNHVMGVIIWGEGDLSAPLHRKKGELKGRGGVKSKKKRKPRDQEGRDKTYSEGGRPDKKLSECTQVE